MGKPLSAAHKRAISEALIRRNRARGIHTDTAVSGFRRPATSTPRPPRSGRVPDNPDAYSPANMARARTVARDVAATEGLEPAVYDTVRQLSVRDGAWVSMTRIREALDGVAPREVVDEVIRSFGRGGSPVGGSVIPEENQKTLTAKDREAAVPMGGKYMHLVALDGDWTNRPAGSKTAPDPAKPEQAPAAPPPPTVSGFANEVPRQPEAKPRPDTKATGMTSIVDAPETDAQRERRVKNTDALRRRFAAASAGATPVGANRFRDQFDMTRREYDRAVEDLVAQGAVHRSRRGITAVY